MYTFWLVVALAVGVALAYQPRRLHRPKGKADEHRWSKAQAEMAEVRKMLNVYASEHDGQYPAQLDALVRTAVAEFSLPKDPFSNDNYIYELTATGFTLTCLGKDRELGGAEIPERDIIFNETGLAED
jgi:hypothetical protein